MSKTELVEFIAAKAGVSKAEAGRVLDATVEGITHGLKKEGKVALIGFGTFTAKRREAREGRNPLTGESMTIKASKSPKFKAGKAFKDSLN